MSKKYLLREIVYATPTIKTHFSETDFGPCPIEPMPRAIEGYKVITHNKLEEDHPEYGSIEYWVSKEVFQHLYRPIDSFLDRLLLERDELQEKLSGLGMFIDSGLFATVVHSKRQRELLLSQRKVMEDYLGILNERIDAFK